MPFPSNMSPLQLKVVTLLCNKFNTEQGANMTAEEFYDMRALEFLNHAVSGYLEQRNNALLGSFEKQPQGTQDAILTQLGIAGKF